MAKNRRKIDPAVQKRLAEVAAGLELAQLPMEQSLRKQASHMPGEHLDCPEETSQAADTDRADLKTQADDVEWDEPAAYSNKARRVFFPQRNPAKELSTIEYRFCSTGAPIRLSVGKV